jgi:hypothetical protein
MGFCKNKGGQLSFNINSTVAERQTKANCNGICFLILILIRGYFSVQFHTLAGSVKDEEKEVLVSLLDKLLIHGLFWSLRLFHGVDSFYSEQPELCPDK